jgi:DNA (cytosine-5)-methyltransferase 1
LNRVVSLFSGAGGMDLGFINHGFKIVWANDFDKAACETYRKNIGDHIVHKDITQIHIDEIPDCDIVIGGSPCQGFSNANRTTHFLDNPKNFLVREFVRVVEGKEPKIFILENVPQILSAGDGQFLQEIKDKLSDYHIEAKILNAAEYNVPQSRRRAIIIGSLIGKIDHPIPISEIHKTVGDVFRNLHSDIPNQDEFTVSKEKVVERMKHVPMGGNHKFIPDHLKTKSKHSTMYKRLDYKQPSVTLVHPIKTLLTHPELNRILSVRECARIQTFPDDHVFYGNLSAKYQQLVNAVPVGLSEAIAKRIKEYIHSL